MLSIHEQVLKLLDSSQRVLVLFGTDKNNDSAAAALALAAFLDKRKKMVDVVSGGFTVPRELAFLPAAETIRTELSNLQKLIIKVDVSKAKIETLSYDIKDNWLSIHLAPKHGTVTKNDLRTAQSGFKYNLIITVGTQDLESLGDVYFNNTDLFFRTPIINIDFRASNDHYGQINCVDLAATSTCETVYKMLETIDAGAIDEKIATMLLTGMISQTRSFKTPSVNPFTLNLASKLINLGADREKIIHHLYRTRSISALKLWGAALTNLKIERDTGLVYTTITTGDFSRAGASEHDLNDLVTELISNSPEAKMILLLHESLGEKNKIRGLLTVDKEYDAAGLMKKYNSKGGKRSTEFFLENSTLIDAENNIISDIKSQVANPAGF